MRIVLIDSALFTWPYDAELALALKDLGHEVSVYGKSIEPGIGGPAVGMLHSHFYKILDHPWIKPWPRGLQLVLKGLGHAISMYTMLREFKANPPDIIHFQWAPLPIVDRWFIPAARRIAPTVLTVHDSAPFNNNPGSFLQSWGATGIMSRFDHLITHTRAAAKRIESYGVNPKRVDILPHGPLGAGADISPLIGASAGPAEKNHPVRILIFGKIKPYKGLDVLMRAVGAMPPEIARQCKVWVVGSPYMDMSPIHELIDKTGITDLVEFDLRFIEDNEIAGILSRADIMVMPYREIDASGVLMMALSAGLPIVASRIGLFAELLEDGKSGMLVGVEDYEALARSLTALVSDSALRDRMAAEVVALRASMPNWNEIGRRTADLYRKLVLDHHAH